MLWPAGSPEILSIPTIVQAEFGIRDSKMPNYIGLDVGGTKIEGVLVDRRLRVLKRVRRPTGSGRSRIIGNVAGVVRELGPEKAKGIGIGTPGFADANGRIQATPNIRAFRNFRLKEALEKELGRRISFGNDAQCFVLAEQRAGCAKGMQHVVGLTLGTGVGGGAIVAGRLLEGRDGGAAHFGHMIINAGVSGMRTVEDCIGGRSMERRYRKIAGRSLSTIEILGSKNRIAEKMRRDLHRNLGAAVAGLINAFNPEAVVLGGGISGSVDVSLLRKEVKKVGEPSLVRRARILKNKLGAAAGVYGAAILAMDQSA